MADRESLREGGSEYIRRRKRCRISAAKKKRTGSSGRSSGRARGRRFCMVGGAREGDEGARKD